MNEKSEKEAKEARIISASEDLPKLLILLFHHCCLLFAVYDPDPLAKEALSVVDSLEDFMKELKSRLEDEYPGRKFLKNFDLTTDTYPENAVWPPNISISKNQPAGDVHTQTTHTHRPEVACDEYLAVAAGEKNPEEIRRLIEKLYDLLPKTGEAATK